MITYYLHVYLIYNYPLSNAPRIGIISQSLPHGMDSEALYSVVRNSVTDFDIHL